MNTARSPSFNLDKVDTYLDNLLTQRKLSPLTVENYRRDLIQLISLAGENNLAELSHLQIRRIVSTLHSKNSQPRSIARKLSAWRSFYQWLAEQISLPSNPIEGIKAPRRVNSLPKSLSVDDAVHLVATQSTQMNLSPGKNSASICNQAMFELLYSSGLRVSELTSLDIHYVQKDNYISHSWINLDEHDVIVTGKGNKKRIVPVGKAAIDAIHNWLIIRDQLTIKPSIDQQSALFINQCGRRMTARTIQLRLKAHGQSLGMPFNIHPHVLRHSFASHVLQSSGDLRAVQEMLGHASIASTQVYTTLDFQHLAKIYDSTHPRAKAK